MQKNVLAASPDAPLQVYAIWFNMYPGDDHSRWPEGLLTDNRVIQLWDAEQVVGSWYGEHVTRREAGHIEWDAWFLYGKEAIWEDGPEPLEGWGRTIAGTRKELAEKISGLLEDRP